MSTALLLGASRGIGFELAKQLHDLGWRVIATARTDDGLARLRAIGCEALRLDVADAASNSGLAWMLDGEKLELVVHVAGVMDRGDAPEPPTQLAFDHVMHTNVLGAMQVMGQLLPLVESAWGVMACISSVMGSLEQTASPSAWLYRVSKAALNMVVRCAQASTRQATVVALHPGWVQTDMGGPQAPLTPEASAKSLCTTLIRLVQEPRAQDRGAFYNHDGTPIAW